MSYYYGREIAMSAGVDMAIGDYVFEFDRISSIGDDIIMKAYYKCIQGTDIVSVTPKKVAGFITKLYYKIYNSEKQDERKPYGIGVIKRCSNETELDVEKREFNHIFSKENDADDMLELLLKNKVTPTSLRDILEDFVLV